MTADAPPVGRLAPSPTGLLHLGHARSFLLAWWHARAREGRVLLRMDDLDTSRVKPGMADQCLRDLEWLGLDWDGDVFWQSRERAGYAQAVEQLVQRGLAYPCVCTRREIELAASAPHASDGTRLYPGTCRGRYASLSEAQAASGRSAALRFIVPPGVVRIDDTFCGTFDQDVAAAIGDFPIALRDGSPAYQLAVVVDDARQGVTEVVRGADLLESTPRQALLLDTLDLPRPRWWHVPLVVDASGRRLAKRSDDLSLAQLRADGVNPRAIVAWAARASGMRPGGRASATELVAEFALSKVPSDPVVLDPASLAALTSERA